jgi:nitrite reductase/ring-hydroxylating ferredoxin subunit
VIDLVSGGVVGPDEGCVKTIPVKIDGGRILLDLSALTRLVA